MSDTPSHPTELAGTPAPFRLRQAREAAGLHIAALAAALKVPVRKLEALEAGRYHELPDMTFARALAASACRHLKIDPAPVLAELPVAASARLTDMSADENTAFKDGLARPLIAPDSLAFLRNPPLVASALIVVAALALFFWPRSPEEPQELVTSPAPSATEPGPVVEPAPAGEPAPAVEPPATAVPALPPAPAAGQPLLKIVGTGESWLEVVDGQGNTVLRRMLKAGDEWSFNERPPYQVLLGHAASAQIQVRGQALDLAPFTRNSVARVEVK